MKTAKEWAGEMEKSYQRGRLYYYQWAADIQHDLIDTVRQRVGYAPTMLRHLLELEQQIEKGKE